MKSSFKILGGFLAGAAIGAVAGILMAPDSGANTRSKVVDESKRLADKLSDSIVKTLGLVKSEAKKNMEEMKNTFNNVTENA